MAPTFPVRSQSDRVVTFRIIGSDEVLQFPCKTCTTVAEAKEFIAEQTLAQEHDIDLFHKSGPYVQKQLDCNQLQPNTLVKGIKSFQPAKMQCPHPTCILGCGYNGLKTAMTYAMDGDSNIVVFDRNDQHGGYCWITGANKTSRLQTEFGSFHVWWGSGCKNSGKYDYPNCNISSEQGGWHIWPYKAEIQKHFSEAAQVLGIDAHVRWSTNISGVDVVGAKDAEDRYYNLTVKNLKDDTTSQVRCSVMWNFPGSLTQNRIIDYPGEDLFEGEIRYGMNDDTPYEKLSGATIAILGNGAFAVENARTCLECGGTKAYIVTRRKNLASPRLPCWFVHQGPFPTPGYLVMKMMEPMYAATNFGDPWGYWSVHADSKRKNVSIIQNSRFGIGDITFLMHAWGLLEYRVAVLKRCSKHTLHLSTGDKLEGVTVVLKALGLLGDYSFDKLHNMKEMVGSFCCGDWRRVVMIDATGMNAANFTTYSTGIGSTEHALVYKYLYDHPQEFYKVSANLMKVLPIHKQELDYEKPAYVTDVRHGMSTMFTVMGMIPKLLTLTATHGKYKYTMYHASHSTDRTMEVARKEWDEWQENWKSRGIEHDYVPYPYTKEMVGAWFKEYSDVITPISIDGPTEKHVFAEQVALEN